MIVDVILFITIIISIPTVIISLYLIKITKSRSAWILISLASVVAAVLRILRLLSRYIDNSFLFSPILFNLGSFFVSCFLFIGLLLVIPIIKSIKSSESRYRTIFDSSGVSLWEEDFSELYRILELVRNTGVTDFREYLKRHPEFVDESIKSIKVIDVNQATLDLFKVKNKEKLMLYIESTFTRKSREVFIKYLISFYYGHMEFESETEYKDTEGNIINAILKIISPDDLKLRKHSIVSITDISARVRAEKELTTALDEKDTLLKELYHRTKNNMQVIIAMLNLRSNSLDNEVVYEAFNDMIGRIKSMALVHEKLYKSDNLSVIRLDEYIEELLSLLVSADTIFNSNIKVLKDLNPVSVDIDRAIPFGLILNELISNTYKHAFKNLDSGEIRISLNQLENQSVEFVVEDNGRGLPPSFDVRNSDTLGLQTVFALGENQLHGSVEVLSPSGEDGCSWHIVFDNRPNISRG